MSIAAEKVKFASERFLLVRINPARFIVPFINGLHYELSFPYVPNKIERNGVALTKDTATPTLNDHWYYDQDAGTIQVKLADDPNSTDNILIAYYFLFYTGVIYRAIGENPEIPDVDIRNWEPKISSYPNFTQSFENILAGVFTISQTSINLINADGSFQQYLSDDDSFCNKQIEIWICINGVENIQKVFTGTIQQMFLNQNSVSLTCVDGFNTLNRPALMGDDPDECFFRRNLSSFPDLDPQFHETPVPYIVGSSSRYQTSAYSTSAALAPDISKISLGTAAPCTDYNATISISTNRTFGICRLKGVPATQSFGSLVRQVSSGTNYRFAKFSGLLNVTIGDTFKWTESGTDYFGIVRYASAFTFGGLDYNLIFDDPDLPFTLSSVADPVKSFNVMIEFQDGSIIYPRYGRDYVVSTSATSGGNNYVSIEFTNNFENSFTEFAGDPLNPNLHHVFFRTSHTVVQTHADIIAEMMGMVSLSTHAASFAAAALALPVNCRFHIPNFDELDYKDYLEYVQDVLKSTLGYLNINSSFEVEYHLLSAPSAAVVRDTSLTLDNVTTCEVDYADITTTIIAFNPHNDSQEALDAANSPSETRQSVKASLLHGIVNVDRFRHVLEEITSNIDLHMAIKSQRRASYSFETATQDIDTELGDDFELVNKIALGGSGTVDLKIMSIDKSPAKIALMATDLKGL